MSTSLHSRIIDVAGNRTYRSLADLTRTSPESVRRYMSGQAPSAEFLSSLCETLGISGHWLLTGRGPVRETEAVQQALRTAKASDLLGAMADTIQQLIERIESLERYVQHIDTLTRSRSVPASAPRSNGESHAVQPSASNGSRRAATAGSVVVNDSARRATRRADAR